MLTERAQRGFSLIELFTAITIIAILIALGMPSLGSYIQTARLGTIAKSFYTGVQLARSQAIQSNQRVDFVQTSSSIASGVENTVVADAAGGNWVVRYGAAGAASLVEARSALDGSGNGPTISVSGTSPTITFNGLGAPTTNATSSIDIVNPTAGACGPGGPVCWRVVVYAGGQVRLCDRSVGSTTSLDTRSCNQP